jgi:formylglycine-generating enzyme required for sulfatase activity
MKILPVLLAATTGWLTPGALLAWISDGLLAQILVVVVTVVLTAILILIFWGGNRLQERLSRQRWRFSTRYPPALAEKHRRLKLIGVYDPADLYAPRLQQVHVTLREAAAGGDGPRLHWNEIFQPGEKRLVILGSPGAGKSTLLDKLVLVFTDPQWHPLRARLGARIQLFPLFARLRELGSERAGSLPALLAQSMPLKKISARFVERRLRRDECLILLDGLDEVPEEKRPWAAEEIERLAGAYPKNYYVITCRTASWHNQLPGFRTYEIQPFTRDDVRRFIGSWYSEVLRTLNFNRLGANPSPGPLQVAESEALAKAAVQTGELWQALAARADLLHVARTPLLASLIALMHHRGIDFPKDRAKLDEWLVETLADVWDDQNERLEDLLDLPAVRGMVEPPVQAPPSLPEILHLSGEGADLGARIRALRTLASLKIQLDADVRQVLERALQEREPELRNAAAWAWCELGRPDELGLVEIPAGEFFMGSVEVEHEHGMPEQPQHMLYLPTFYIGRNPVTVSDFSKFLAVSGYKLEKENRFHKWNRHADHPVRVGWNDALEYSRWRGMSLPSEAEWEKAARGVDGRRYPWGNEWKAGYANALESWPSRRKATTTPVGSFSPQGDSPYGCSDMAGNVWEWTRNASADPYPYDPADGRETLGASGFQVVRGGAADESSRHVRCAIRGVYDFRTPYTFTGFRLVLTPFSSVL